MLMLMTCLAAPDPARAERTRWMAEGSFGLMVHYLIAPPGETDAERTAAFSRIVDGFDLDAFMAAFEVSGADWLIFTIGQNTGYYCSPNAFLDEAVPGRTSRRDLALEVARRVKGLGKRFVAYLPAEVSWQKGAVQEAFAWNPADQREFQERYQDFIRAYAEKFGDLLDGWWFDGCYTWDVFPNRLMDWPAWLAAAKAGNPAAIVAFNDGAFCINNVPPVTPLEDYHAGEVHMLVGGKIKLGHEPDSPLWLPTERFIDGVQVHCLVPVDSTFEGGEPYHYSDDELFGFVDACRAVQAGATLNLPVGVDGVIPAASAEQVRRLGQHLGVGFARTASGLAYRDRVVGDGPMPRHGQRVRAHYVGTLLDGTEFDSSRRRGQPFEFRLGQGEVIAGWDEGLASMRVGGKRVLLLPPELAYGEAGAPPDIPPGATLRFEVELVSIR